jgi:hypothetical protein
VVNEFGRGLWYSALLEVVTGPDAYEGSAGHTFDDRVRIVDEAHPDCQIDPVFRHIPREVRKNQIDLKAGIE